MEKPHKKLDVWNQSMELVTEVYTITEIFPKEERYTLTTQLRRSAISIPSNIAEGAARRTQKEFVNYLHTARGSLSELDTQLEVARRLGYIDEENSRLLDQQLERIDKMISGLIRHQRQSAVRGITT